MDLIDHGIRQPGGNFGYIAPLRTQAKSVAWEYVKEFARPIFGKPPNESELHINLINNSRITLFGAADNPDALRGLAWDGVVLDEYADMPPSLLPSIVRPALADRGGFAVVMGTVKGRNQLWRLYEEASHDPSWYAIIGRASETGILSAQELANARQLMTEEAYAAEFECDPHAAIAGAFYGRELARAGNEGRIRQELDFAAKLPVHTAWDFGNGANMAVWVFQVAHDGRWRPQILVHDFIQESGWYFDDYLAEVNRRGYKGTDYVPHDAKVPNFETGRTRIETMIAAGRKPALVPDHHIGDGINAVKLTFPRFIFNAGNCDKGNFGGIEALRQYRSEWDEKARVFKKSPKHDWTSHPADALRYLAMAWRELIEPKVQKPLFVPIEEMTIDQWLGEYSLREKRERA
ncbi:MAG: hypothetical protein ACREBU_01780 [Nitrososphaera sp.]